LAYLIEEGRNTMIFGKAPDFSSWIVATLLSIMIAWAGFVWFQKTKNGFADVLYKLAGEMNKDKV
jgi:lipopolysaccharide transport system permease protein